MNKYKLISLMSFLLVSLISFGQSPQAEPKEERVVVLIDDQAIVATLDSTGALDQKVLDIPSYFDEEHNDAYYVALSYKSDILKKETIIRETITSIDTSLLQPKESQQ